MRPDRRAFLSLSLTGIPLRLGASSAAASPHEGDAFDRALARLREVDEGLIGYDETDRVILDLSQPRGIAAGSSGRLWVVGDRALLSFVAGREERRVVLSGEPSCVCEGPEGDRVLVGLRDRVEVWRADGRLLSGWRPRGGEAAITSIAVGGGQVFVADAGHRTVQRHDLDGLELGRLGDTSGPPRHFVVPSPFLDLAVSAAVGVLWVTNPGRHRVESYAFDGTPLATLGTSGAAIDGFCGCCNPTHIAVLPDGRLLTSEKGLPRVKVLSHSGGLDSVVVGGDRLAPGVVGLDLAVDDAERVLVLDPQQRAVRVFTPHQRKREQEAAHVL